MQKQAGKVAWQLQYTDCAFLWLAALFWRIPRGAKRPLCSRRSTLHPIVASGRAFKVCPSPDVTPCARHCDVLTKWHAHHCIQNCNGQAHQTYTRTGDKHHYRSFSHIYNTLARWVSLGLTPIIYNIYSLTSTIQIDRTAPIPAAVNQLQLTKV